MPFIKDVSFVWNDFTSFLAAYDFAAQLFRTEEDYARFSQHCLTSLAHDGTIYSEVFTSPDHAPKARLSPMAYTNALSEGMARAKARSYIEGRMVVTGGAMSASNQSRPPRVLRPSATICRSPASKSPATSAYANSRTVYAPSRPPAKLDSASPYAREN